jgi:hypothetical protein
MMFMIYDYLRGMAHLDFLIPEEEIRPNKALQ